MIAKPMKDKSCVICGIPLDAECFDVSGFAGVGMPLDASVKPLPLPGRGEQAVLASFQLHPQYCGALTYFAQYTDLNAKNNENIQTPGFEWIITQNGKPVFPYTRLELIVNPWGEVLADSGEDGGVIIADIDPAKVAEARAMIPALKHDRKFSGPGVPAVTRAAGE